MAEPTELLVYTCLSCGHIQDRLHLRLRFAAPCPACLRPDTFGPGTFADDYEGMPISQALFERDTKTVTVRELRKKYAGF